MYLKVWSKMTLINLLLSAVLQVTFVLLICYFVYRISYRRQDGVKPSFRQFLGLVKAERSSLWMSIGIGLTLGLCTFAVNVSGCLQYFSDYQNFAASSTSPIAPIKQGGWSLFSFSYAAVYAVIQTGLSEEIFFRGLIAKRLIKKLGYKIGNFAQSLIFPTVHVMLIIGLRPNSSFALVGLFFVIPLILGYFMGYLNERKGNGSIVPSWIVHSSTNLFVALAAL